MKDRKKDKYNFTFNFLVFDHRRCIGCVLHLNSAEKSIDFSLKWDTKRKNAHIRHLVDCKFLFIFHSIFDRSMRWALKAIAWHWILNWARSSLKFNSSTFSCKDLVNRLSSSLLLLLLFKVFTFPFIN